MPACCRTNGTCRTGAGEFGSARHLARQKPAGRTTSHSRPVGRHWSGQQARGRGRDRRRTGRAGFRASGTAGGRRAPWDSARGGPEPAGRRQPSCPHSRRSRAASRSRAPPSRPRRLRLRPGQPASWPARRRPSRRRLPTLPRGTPTSGSRGGSPRRGRRCAAASGRRARADRPGARCGSGRRPSSSARPFGKVKDLVGDRLRAAAVAEPVDHRRDRTQCLGLWAGTGRRRPAA